MTSFFHLWCVDIENSLVVCFMIFSKDFMKFWVWLISISCTSLLCHLNSTVRHECSLKRLVCLKTYNLLKVFHTLIDIPWAICCQSGYYICFHIKNATFCTFFFLKLLKSSPQFVGCFSWSFQERVISFIWSVVILDKTSNIYRMRPVSSFKSCPLFVLCHIFTSPFPKYVFLFTGTV